MGEFIDKCIEVSAKTLQEAIEFIMRFNKDYKIYLIAADKRKRSLSQNNFMYVIITEFIKEKEQRLPDEAEREEWKNIFYSEYLEATNQDRPLKTSILNVTQMRLFLDWLIKFLAVEEGFSLALDLVEEQFKTQWIYANTCARICCITGKPGADICHVSKAVGMGRDRTKIDHTKFKVISLSREYHVQDHANPDFLKEKGLYGVTLSEYDFKRLGVRGKFEKSE